MDRLTNGELDMVITAIIHVLDADLTLVPDADAALLESALLKLQAQQKAQD